MDFYAEYMIRRAKTGTDKLMSVVYVLGALVLTALIAFVSLYTGQFMVMIWFLVAAAVWYLCYRLIRKQNVEYEYIFTNGDLEVDVIYAKSLRRNLVTLRMQDISVCARRDDERFEKQYNHVPEHLLLISAVSNVPGAKVYFVDFLYNAERTRLLFEPSKKILDMMKKYNPKNVHIPGEE